MAEDTDFEGAIPKILDTRQWVSISTIMTRLHLKEGRPIMEADVKEALDSLVEDGHVERDGTGSRNGRYRLRDGAQ